MGVDPTLASSLSAVAERSATVGPNAVERADPPRLWRMVVASATQPFVLLLLAAGVGAILLGEVRDGWLVLLGLVPIVGADVVTEYRGERALEALRAASAPTRPAAACRAPSSTCRPPRSFPGDVVLLRVGDVVPGRRAALPGGAARHRSQRAHRGIDPRGGDGRPGRAGDGRVTERRPCRLCRDERGRRPRRRASRSRPARGPSSVASPAGLATEGAPTLAAAVRAGPPRPDPPRRGHRPDHHDGRTRASSAATPSERTCWPGSRRRSPPIPEEPPVLVAVVLGLGAYRLLRRGRAGSSAQRRGGPRRDRPRRHGQDRHAHPEPARGRLRHRSRRPVS